MILGFFMLWSWWPLRGWWFAPWWQSSLVVFLNPYEARPCGGFVSQYGYWERFPWTLELRDVFSLPEGNFGPSNFPLTAVSAQQKFWDLATTANLEVCTEQFHQAFEQLSAEKIDQVLLVQWPVLIEMAQSLGIPFSGSEISRQVADLDRHSRADLVERKDFSQQLAQAFKTRLLTRPWQWRTVAKKINQATINREIYWSAISQKLDPSSHWQLHEWNLGGGKSSRYLQRQLDWDWRQISAEKWQVEAQITLKNLSDWDVPLGQPWQGVVELSPPLNLGVDPHWFEPPTLGPAERWSETKSWVVKAPQGLDFLSSPGQDWLVNLSVSALAQQSLQSNDLHTRESIGTSSKLTNQQSWEWDLEPDTKAPFVVWHEFIPPPQTVQGVEFSAENRAALWAEIHFNEVVESPKAAWFQQIALQQADRSAAPDNWYLLPDQRSLHLRWNKSAFLPRAATEDQKVFYQLSLPPVSDRWGNASKNREYTLVESVKNEL